VTNKNNITDYKSTTLVAFKEASVGVGKSNCKNRNWTWYWNTNYAKAVV